MQVTKETNTLLQLNESNKPIKIFALLLLALSVLILIYRSYDTTLLWIALLMTAGAVFMFLNARNRVFLIDKTAMRIGIKENTLLSNKSEVISIAEIDHIDVRKVEKINRSNEGYNETRIDSNVLLVFKDGSEILLNKRRGLNTSLPFGAPDYQKAGQIIARFLDIPYQKSNRTE